MSKIVIIDGNTDDKNNEKIYMVKGEKGYSAYDLYVQNGGTLTEEEWLNAFLNADNFYNKTEVDNIIDDTLDSYYDKTEVDDKVGEKVSITDIVDDLVSTDTDKPLSANQGKELKGLIDGLLSWNEIARYSTADSNTTLTIPNFEEYHEVLLSLGQSGGAITRVLASIIIPMERLVADAGYTSSNGRYQVAYTPADSNYLTLSGMNYLGENQIQLFNNERAGIIVYAR